MKVKDAAMQAFPFIEPNADDAIKAYHPGMTMRDEFAKAAMQALIIRADKRSADEVELWIGSIAYEVADAMLEAKKA